MKLRSIILPLLAVGSIAAAQIGSANAYFTTYVTATGYETVSWKHEEHINEEFNNWHKYVTVASKEDSVPIFVRAAVFFGDKEAGYDVSISGENWVEDGDYWYFLDPVPGGGTTKDLVVGIENFPAKLTPEDGDNFNVVVVYECIPATYNDDGRPKDPRSNEVDWTESMSFDDPTILR